MNPTIAVTMKELRETLRDPNAVAMCVLYPVLGYPLMVWAANLWFEYQSGQTAGEVTVVATAEPLASVFAAEEGLATVPLGEETLEDGGVLAIVRATPNANDGLDVVTEWRSDLPASGRARERIKNALGRERERRAEAEAVSHGLDPAMARVKVEVEEIDRKTEMLPFLLSMILPSTLVLNGIIAGFYPTIEAAVGERERGTLETTLVSGAPRSAIVAGKLLCVFAIVSAATLVNFGVALLCLWQLLHGLGKDVIVWTVAPAALAGVLACALVATAVLNAWVLYTALHAKDFKQAQNIASGILVLGMGLTVLGILPGFGPELGAGLVPVTNLVLVMREWLAGRDVMPWAAIALVQNLALTALPTWLAARAVGAERWRFARGRA